MCGSTGTNIFVGDLLVVVTRPKYSWTKWHSKSMMMLSSMAVWSQRACSCWCGCLRPPLFIVVRPYQHNTDFLNPLTHITLERHPHPTCHNPTVSSCHQNVLMERYRSWCEVAISAKLKASAAPLLLPWTWGPIPFFFLQSHQLTSVRHLSDAMRLYQLVNNTDYLSSHL